MSQNTFLKTLNFKEIGFLLFTYSIIYFWYTYPTITCFSTAVIGKDDPFQVIWNMYIFETGLHAGKLWTTHQSFYPWNTSLIFHEYTPFLDVLSFIIHNKILLLNIVIYGMFISSAVGAFYLSKQFISNRYFAFICGFIFAFSPYKMSRIEEHYPLIQTVIIPCFFLVFIKTFSFESFNLFPRIKSFKNIVLLVCLGLFSITLDYLVTFQMAYLSVLYFLFFYIYKFYLNNKRYFWIYLAAFFVLMHILIAWLLHIGIDEKGAFWWSGKWSDYIIPYNSIVYSGLTTKLWNYFEIQSRSIESVLFIGYSFILVLVLTFFILLKKRIFDLKIQALIFCFLMLFLMVMPVFKLPFSFTFYPPTAILHFLPIIKNLRCPTRFINVIMLVAPIIVFYVLEQLNFKSRYKIAFASLFFLLLFIEYFPKRYAYIDFKSIPKVYYVLKDKPNESVLVYPLGVRDGFKLKGKFDIVTMQYQTIYRKKTMGGYSCRLEDWMWYVHYQNAFTNTLLQLEKDSTFTIPQADYSAAIKEIKLDYVVIPKRYINEKAAVFLQSVINPFVTQKEIIDGDLLISLKR
jgi:hypothetical protein